MIFLVENIPPCFFLRMSIEAFLLRPMGPLLVAVLRRKEATALILHHLENKRKINVAFANTNLITQAHRNPHVAKTMADFLILNDGIGLEIASHMFHRAGFPDNLNGTDFTPHLLASAPAGTRVFLYGSKPHVVKKAAPLLEASCGIKVVGTQDGYSPVSPAALCQRINESKAEIVLVATGNPRQEEWIALHHAQLKAPVCIGVGALLDFTANEFRRAPQWVQRIHMEWFFRLANEPRRLARRYTLDILYFLYICWMYKRKNKQG